MIVFPAKIGSWNDHQGDHSDSRAKSPIHQILPMSMKNLDQQLFPHVVVQESGQTAGCRTGPSQVEFLECLVHEAVTGLVSDVWSEQPFDDLI